MVMRGLDRGLLQVVYEHDRWASGAPEKHPKGEGGGGIVSIRKVPESRDPSSSSQANTGDYY